MCPLPWLLLSYTQDKNTYTVRIIDKSYIDASYIGSHKIILIYIRIACPMCVCVGCPIRTGESLYI